MTGDFRLKNRRGKLRRFLFGRGGGICLKADDGFIGLCIAELFAGEARDGGGVVAERVNVGAQLAGNRFLFLQLAIKSEDFAAHPLVLLDGLLVGQANKNEDGQRDEDDDRLREPAPDAEINFHATSLTARGAEVKADFADNRRRPD